MIKDVTIILCYLGQSLNKFKGNKSIGASGKVNLAIVYRNELGSENSLLPKGERGHSTPKDQL